MLPPQATELEQVVLGALMLEKDKLMQVRRLLPVPECFYKPAHQHIYAAILELDRCSIHIDILTVCQQLTKDGNLDSAGGALYVTDLTLSVVTSAHIESHAMLIAEKWMKREQIRIAAQMMQEGYDDSEDVFESLNSGIMALDAIAQSAQQNDPKPIQDIYNSHLKHIEEARNAGEEIAGASWGFSSLNELTNGIQRKRLIIVAARPGVGKTAFALQISSSMVANTPKCTGLVFFSLEMDAEELVARKMASINQISLDSISKPKRLQQHEFEKLTKSIYTLQGTKIFIDDTAGISWMEVRNKCRTLKLKHNISHVVIDYLQLMSGDRTTGKGNREQEISTISRELKKMGKDLDLGIIALSQLSREVEKRANGKPKLSDLRESGAIEQDANVVIFLYGPTEEDTIKDPSVKNIRYWDIAKNRGGTTGEGDFDWHGPTQTFYLPGQSPKKETPFPNPRAGFQNFVSPKADFSKEY